MPTFLGCGLLRPAVSTYHQSLYHEWCVAIYCSRILQHGLMEGIEYDKCLIVFYFLKEVAQTHSRRSGEPYAYLLFPIP